jgi:hypothetical protein
VVLIGFLIALTWALPAEAGKRGRRSKKARARAEARAESQKRRQEPMPTPAPSVASNDDGAGRAPAGGAARAREKVFDFSAIELGGSERMPQLLYFLDRADEELERASLERRSFVPEMMRTLDEENL